MGFDPDALHRQLLRLPRPAGWCVAFSGGLDSSVLLHALAALRDRLDAPLRALHVHHGLLPEAEAWTAHCRRVCEALEVPLTVLQPDWRPRPGESLEAEAREARYRALGEALGRDEMLLLAQHRDDQAETLLLQLLRGAGIQGLAGMPRCRRWERGWQARPLLDFDREALRRWAEQEGLSWVEDPSNADLRFDRNFVRHQVMPLLRERWPAASRSIARSAGHLADSLARLEAAVAADLAACRRGRRLSVAALQALPPAHRPEVLRAWLREQGRRPPPRPRLVEFLRQLEAAGPDAAPRLDWEEAALRRYRDRLWLLPRVLPRPPAEPLAWSGDEVLALPRGSGRLRRRPAATGVPGHCWEQGLVTVRWQVEGARCRLPGGRGSRGLRKLCQEAGVPPWVRPWLPLVFVGDALAAVPGVAACEVVAPRPGEPCWEIVWEERPDWLQFEEETDGIP